MLLHVHGSEDEPVVLDLQLAGIAAVPGLAKPEVQIELLGHCKVLGR